MPDTPFRVQLRAPGGSEMIPRHGQVTRGETRVNDPASRVIQRAWTVTHGGRGIPRLTNDFEEIERALLHARQTNDEPAVQQLTTRLRQHECPVRFCADYNPNNTIRWTARDAADAAQLCTRTANGRYVAAVMPWQTAVAQYCWGSRRSVLLSAQTGAGKTVVQAFCIQLIQFIDQGQGGVLGLGPNETNVSILMSTADVVEGAAGYRASVMGELTKRVGAPASALETDIARGRPVVQTLQGALLERLGEATYAANAIGTLHFSVYGAVGKAYRANDVTYWNHLTESVESAFVILDEVQHAPFQLLLAIARARESAAAAHLANPDTVDSSPTTLMLSATPYAAGVLHFSNILRCLDNNDSGVEVGRQLVWPDLARDLAQTYIRPPVRHVDVRHLLNALGLSLQSIVRVGDAVVLANGAVAPKKKKAGEPSQYTVVFKDWDPVSGLELVRLELTTPDAPNKTGKRRGVPGNAADHARLGLSGGQHAWWPALLCRPVATGTFDYDVQLWYHGGSIEVTERGFPEPSGRTLCSYCRVVAVPTPATLWEYTSVEAVVAAMLWEAAQSPAVEHTATRVSARIAALPEAARADRLNQLKRVADAIPGDPASISAKNRVVGMVNNMLRGNLAAPEPHFVPVTEPYFLGHTAFAQLDHTHLYPTAEFRLDESVPTIAPVDADARAQRWLVEFYPDADVTGTAALPAYQAAAEHLWGATAWTRLNAAVRPATAAANPTAVRGLLDHNYFNQRVRPWMPWAACCVHAAMRSAVRAGLPVLYYCFLTPRRMPDSNGENLFGGPCTALRRRDGAKPLAGTANLFQDLRAAWVVATSALLADGADGAHANLDLALAAFYPKATRVPLPPAGPKLLVTYAAALMRYVALQLMAVRGTALLARTPDEGDATYAYHAFVGTQAFRAIHDTTVLDAEWGTVAGIHHGAPEPAPAQGEPAPQAAPQAVPTGASRGNRRPGVPHDPASTVGLQQVDLQRAWKRAQSANPLPHNPGSNPNGAEGPIRVVISDVAGATGADFANYDAMYVLAPPATDDELTQMLGRIRRMQGLCMTDAARVCRYTVVIDKEGVDTRKLSVFKTLARPVNAMQLHGARAHGGGGLAAPKTAWDVIQEAARAGGGGGDQTVPRFDELPFAAHALSSRDAVAFLALTTATYTWKRVVDSAANDFGIIGARDLDLGVAGDTSFFECLVDRLDDALAAEIHNAMRMTTLTFDGHRGVFMPEPGRSHVLSMRVYRSPTNPVQKAVAQLLLSRPGGTPLAAFIMGGAVNPGPPGDSIPWPEADDTTYMWQALATDTAADVPGWADESNEMLRILGSVLRIVTDGGESMLLKSTHHACGTVRFVDGSHRARFAGDWQTDPNFDDPTAVEIDQPRAAETDPAVLMRVAAGDQDPQAVWFWACRDALEASVTAAAVAEAVRGVVDTPTPPSAEPREARFRQLAAAIVHDVTTSLAQASGPAFGNDQVVPAGRPHVDLTTDPLTAARSVLAVLDGSERVARPTDIEAEQEARERTVGAMAVGPVACGVYAESGDRSIRMPCRNQDVVFNAFATQVRADAPHGRALDSLAFVHMREILDAADAHLQDRYRRGQALRELSPGEDVFRPAVAGDAGDWTTHLAVWVDAIIDATTPDVDERVQQTHAFPSVHHRQQPVAGMQVDDDQTRGRAQPGAAEPGAAQQGDYRGMQVDNRKRPAQRVDLDRIGGVAERELVRRGVPRLHMDRLSRMEQQSANSQRSNRQAVAQFAHTPEPDDQ
jgi:hypothetical protein